LTCTAVEQAVAEHFAPLKARLPGFMRDLAMRADPS
jgi:hypothetical protein